MTLRHRTLIALLALSFLTACDESGSAIEPGPLQMVLAAPGDEDGILLLSITGGPVISVEGGTHQVAFATLTEVQTRVIVRGRLTDGVIATVTVPDPGRVASYAVTIQQVAARPDYELRSLDGFSAKLLSP